MAQRLGLKVDVDTYRGTCEGVPRLTEVLTRHQAGATFLFSLGPDHTGRAIRRALTPGFLTKTARTSVVEHYGLKTLLYGTLLPGPDIGRRCAHQMRAVRDAGFEVGIHAFDHVKWQDFVARRDAAWTEGEIERAIERFEEVFDAKPRVHGAAGWQMNSHAFRALQRMGFDYASDMRGTHPFLPVCDGETMACPQLPTTLPTLDELIGRDGLDAGNVAGHVLALSEDPPPQGHVYTLHAELEGMKLLPVLERLITGWQRRGYELVSLRELFSGLDAARLPRHVVTMGEIPGRSGSLALQGAPCAS